jgi:hypothetical protein
MYIVESGSGFRLWLNPYIIQTLIQTKICSDKMLKKCILKPLKRNRLQKRPSAQQKALPT